MHSSNISCTKLQLYNIRIYYILLYNYDTSNTAISVKARSPLRFLSGCRVKSFHISVWNGRVYSCQMTCIIVNFYRENFAFEFILKTIQDVIEVMASRGNCLHYSFMHIFTRILKYVRVKLHLASYFIYRWFAYNDKESYC